MLITSPNKQSASSYETNYSFLRKHKEEYYATIASARKCISPVSWMTIMPHKEALRWLYWVNKNICLNIDYEDFKTIGVKLRIATGMLNKLESLTDEEKIQIHSNLVRNVNKEYFEIQASRLPF